MFRFAHFEYIYYYGGFAILIPLLFVVFWLQRKYRFNKLGNAVLVQQLMPERSNAKPIIKIIFLTIAAICLVIGIANPQIGSRIENVKREGIDLVIALDISRSMNAQDVKPDRMERAKQLASRLIDKLESDRIALVVFAGNAYVQMPLTIDHSAAKIFLSTVSTDMAGTQGTALGEAIEVGQSLFSEKSKAAKAILLISDGEDHEGKAIEQAEDALKAGTLIYTIGVGTEQGSPIPLYKDATMIGFQKDESGSTVISKLDDGMLRKIADAGEGKYFRLSDNNQVMEDVEKELNKLKKGGIESKLYSDYDDQFQWLLSVALLLITCEFILSERKSKLFNWKPF